MTKPICATCGKCCANIRKGWPCASNDKKSDPRYLAIRRKRRSTHTHKGWLHVHAGMPYGFFTTKAACLADIAWKAGNNPLSKARRAVTTTTTVWK